MFRKDTFSMQQAKAFKTFFEDPQTKVDMCRNSESDIVIISNST